MRHPPRGPALATGILLSSLLATALPAGARQSSPDAIVQPDALSVQGQEIPQISTPRLHVTRGADGLMHVRVYLSPLGSPGGTSWQARDTTLSVQNADGTRSPAASPFKLRVAGSAGAATLAALTNEDGVGLRLNLGGTIAPAPAPAALGSQTSTVAGTGVIDVPGQVAGNVITYPAALAGGHQDLAVESAHEGVRLRLTARDAQGGAALAAAISLDHPVTFRQDPGGAIVVTRQIQGCGSTGCIPVDQPEYVIGPPVVTDASGAAPRTLVGAPATLRVASSSANGAQIAVSLDPAWLATAGRAFPLAITVPVETAASAVELGTEGSVSSCAPTAPASHGDLTVGTAGGCSSRGILYFDMGSTILQSPIQAAALHLYAPGQSGAVAVQVFAGAPPAKQTFPTPVPIASPAIAAASPTADASSPTPSTGVKLLPPPDYSQIPPAQPADFRVPPRPAYQPPTDADVRAAAGAQGIAAQGSGPWQSWDVTGIVQNWISQGYAANGGFVLASDSAPVQIAAARGSAEADPTLAPYLDLTLAPAISSTTHAAAHTNAPARIMPRAIDNPTPANQRTTFGLGQGLFEPGGTCNQLGILSSIGCSYYGSNYAIFADNGVNHEFIEMPAVTSMGLSYVRGNSITISCNSADWTYSSYWQYVYNYMQNAYNANLIPIVTFVQEPKCPFTNTSLSSDLALALEWFGYLMPTLTMPVANSSQVLTDPPMLFEIGNEANGVDASKPGTSTNWNNFPQWFGAGARGLQLYLSSHYNHPVYTHYTFITGGVIGPKVSSSCDYSPPTQIGQLAQALAVAQSSGNNADPYNAVYLPGVNQSHLAVGSHPYGYSVNTGEFANFASQGGLYGEVCNDLSYIANWKYSYFGDAYVNEATEDNYNSPPSPPSQAAANLQGGYIMDLFTWLYWNLGADGQWNYSRNGILGERGYPFNMMWFEGMDDTGAGQLLGLYGRSPSAAPSVAAVKAISFVPSCPGQPYIYQGSFLRDIMGYMDMAGGGQYLGSHCSN